MQICLSTHPHLDSSHTDKTQPIMNVEAVASSSSSAHATQEVAQRKGGRTPGKAHKSAKAPLRRSYISESIKTPFAKRMEEEQKKQAVKAVEKEMKDDKEADRQM